MANVAGTGSASAKIPLPERSSAAAGNLSPPLGHVVHTPGPRLGDPLHAAVPSREQQVEGATTCRVNRVPMASLIEITGPLCERPKAGIAPVSRSAGRDVILISRPCPPISGRGAASRSLDIARQLSRRSSIMRPWIASVCSLGLAGGAAFLDVSVSGTRVQPAAGTTGSPAWTTLAESHPDCRRGGSDGAPLQRPSPAQLGMGVDGCQAT